MPDDRQRKTLQRFGANLRRARVAKGVTQQQLAELTDLNVRTVQKIEAGETNILITTAIRIQDSLHCQWDELMPN